MEQENNIVVRIKVTNLSLTPAIDDYTRKKVASLDKFLSHYADLSGELIFDVEIGKTTMHHKSGDVFRAEINFTAGGTTLRAEAEKDDLYAAIDEAKDEMKRELRRYKNKYAVMTRKAGARIKDLLRKFY